MPSSQHPELLFDSELVTVALSPAQQAQLQPLVSRQVVDRKGLLFLSVAPFWNVDGGETQLRLQAVFVPRKAAGKILKLIQAELGK